MTENRRSEWKDLVLILCQFYGCVTESLSHIFELYESCVGFQNPSRFSLLVFCFVEFPS